MKPSSSETDSTVVPAAPKRRGMLLGAGVAAAAGAVAVVGARTLQTPRAEPAAAVPKGAEADGYRLSQHVLRYYETAKV